jgi:hypothetical protein
MSRNFSVSLVDKQTNGIGWRDQKCSFFKLKGLIVLISNFKDQKHSMSKL